MSSLDGLGLETARPPESSRDMGKKKLGAKTTDRRRTFFCGLQGHASVGGRNGQPVKMPHIRYLLFCEKERATLTLAPFIPLCPDVKGALIKDGDAFAATLEEQKRPAFFLIQGRMLQKMHLLVLLLFSSRKENRVKADAEEEARQQ